MKYIREILEINIIVLFFIILSILFDFRICLFYNLFHIPCPGCGTTRAFALIFEGHLIKSLEYSFIPIILITLFFIVLLWSIIDSVNKKNTLQLCIQKNKNILIILSVIITIIIWIININNPNLY